ncbi:MAG: hypothetical protein ABEJ88_05795 [Halobacterium sp.]
MRFEDSPFAYLALASAAALGALAASILLFGVSASFPAFLARSLAVMGLTLLATAGLRSRFAARE